MPDTALTLETRPRGTLPLLLLVAGAQFMENLDGTIITTALPTMAHSFGRAAVDLNIGISAYLLALGVFIPASGWVTDRFGARRTFALAIGLFTLSSVLCGLAQGLGGFVAVRVIQGMAGAMMVPVGRLVVLRETPRDRLMDAMAMLVWPALVAPVLGPPLGGFITTHASWRWIFYLNLPLGLVALVAAWRLVPDFAVEDSPPFDWTGFALCGVGVSLLLYGLEQLVAAPGAASLGAAAGGAVLVWLAVRHFAAAAHPMIDLGAYRVQTFRTAARGGSLMRMAVGSAPFLLPLMFQVGFGYSAQTSGLLMLGIFGANLGMKTISSQTLRRFGFRPVMLWNGLLCVATLAACALLNAATPIAIVVMVLMLGGAGRSMQFTTITMITFSDIPQDRMNAANGLFSTVAQVTMGMGITLGAMSVRLGALAARHWGVRDPATPYHVAFVIVAGVALLSLVEVLVLPPGAGNHFTRKGG
jgi:EmrB/QacA subfamily drug resistance transporter